MGGKIKQTHTEEASRRPKSRWQTARDEIDGWGRRKGKTTKFAACVVDSLMSTTRLVGLLIVHGRARCPSRGIGDHHATRVRGRWVYGLDHNGDRGGVRGLKNSISLALRALAGGRTPQRACVSAFGYGFDRVCRGSTQHTPRQSNSPVRPQRDRGNTESKQAEKGSWLKQVGKVKRVEK